MTVWSAVWGLGPGPSRIPMAPVLLGETEAEREAERDSWPEASGWNKAFLRAVPLSAPHHQAWPEVQAGRSGPRPPHRIPGPALTFHDAPLGLAAQHAPPVHHVLPICSDHRERDPLLGRGGGGTQEEAGGQGHCPRGEGTRGKEHSVLGSPRYRV